MRDGPDLSRRDLLQRAGTLGLAAALPGVLAACGASGNGSGGAPVSKVAQRPGGNLRVAITFGAGDTYDPTRSGQAVEHGVCRQRNVYERLMQAGPDGSPVPMLAEALEPNARGDVWTVKLRSGVTFHEGQPLTADDVVWSLRRYITDETLGGGGDLTFLRASGIRKVDASTVRLELDRPSVLLAEELAWPFCAIVPDGTKTVSKPNGTGPFRWVSKNQREEVWERNPEYWRDGRPFLDGVRLMNIGDPRAQFNALRTNEIDAIAMAADLTQLRIVENDRSLTSVLADAGGCVPLVMRFTSEPFTDPRVALAFKLLADRELMLKQAQGGHGTLGNDMIGANDPLYPKDLPQRTRDVEQAKSLLQQAGQSDLRIVLHTSSLAPGMQESALVFSQNCEEAGVRCELKRYPADSYYAAIYGKVPFSQTRILGGKSILRSYQLNLAPKAPGRELETNWRNPRADALYTEAIGTLDEARRGELVRELSGIIRDEAGYVIWGFGVIATALRANVAGVTPHDERPLNNLHLVDVSLNA